LHILDLVQNSIEAEASKVVLNITEDFTADILLIQVVDNGRGMDELTRRKVVDPFYTTRQTRRIGLGLPLIAMTAEQCGGYLKIASEPGQGTMVEACYRHKHIDRPPLGNIADTVKTVIVANPDLDFEYCHTVNDGRFRMTTREITAILGDIPLSNPDVLVWLDQYLKEQLANLYGGVQDENS